MARLPHRARASWSTRTTLSLSRVAGKTGGQSHISASPGHAAQLPRIMGGLGTDNLSFTCEFAWYFLQICCKNPDIRRELERDLRYSESQRLPCRALSGAPCQPCHRSGHNHAGHHRPAGPPPGARCRQRYSPSAWASAIPHLPPTVTTLVFPRSLSPKKRRHRTLSP